ncbi:MAG: sulfotransferase [Leptolyngbya sp. SIO4C1]|nr:sulfotransferase [Leptolyngbya sp. SIO4C1]
MTMPNFLIVGAQKAGTTTLAQHLSRHPQIYISSVKEPGFFDFEGREPDFRGPNDQALYQHMVTDLKTYQSLFTKVAQERAIGEATTWYLYSPEAPKRIAHYIPTVKIVAILRHPVDRAYSAFLHATRDRRETVSDFTQALDLETDRIAQNWEYLWRYQQMGFYATQLRRYFQHFDKSQIKIYLYEDLSQAPEALLSDLCDFLDVDSALMPKLSKRLNASGIPKNRLLHSLLSSPNPLRKMLKPLIPSQELREQIRLRLKNRNLSKPRLSAETRAELTQRYRADILQLEALIDRDLSHWLRQ